MGRSSKNKRKHQQQQQLQQGGKSKRQRMQRFWILDCQDSSKSQKQDDDEEDDAADVEILVTRIELSDTYRQVPPADQDTVIASQVESGGKDIASDELATKEASIEARFEDHEAPIHSFVSYVGQRSLVDLEEQKESPAIVKVAIQKAASAKRPILQVCCC
jgi:hypothetical protein